MLLGLMNCKPPKLTRSFSSFLKYHIFMIINGGSCFDVRGSMIFIKFFLPYLNTKPYLRIYFIILMNFCQTCM